MKAIIISSILLLFVMTGSAQSIDAIFSQKMYNMPLFPSDLNFHYVGIDTVTGVEINYSYHGKDTCFEHLFLITDATKKDVERACSLVSFLTSAGAKYHYLKYNYYTSVFGCESNDIDTFRICNDETGYSLLVKDTTKSVPIYKSGDHDFYSLSYIKVVVYRFVSKDVKYSKYFYHFDNDLKNVTSIEKLIYKQVLKRTHLKAKTVLGGNRINYPIECITRIR